MHWGESRRSRTSKKALEAKLALGDIGLFEEPESRMPAFGDYADSWIKNYAKMECKPSTVDGYEGVLRLYLRPTFAPQRLNEIKREQIKGLISDMVAKGLARSTVRNTVSVLRSIFNDAIEDRVIESNPAVRLGRFTRAAKTTGAKGVALTPVEIKQFLNAANQLCPQYWALFLLAVRAGLRRGELVALQWGDIEFGKNKLDENRFIVVQHNYVRRKHTSTKSRKARRVDMS